MNDSSISVIIATYNRRATVGRALDSVLAQTWKSVEIIVVDDCSADGTAEWLAGAYPNIRLVALSQNRGAAAARNAGIREATASLVAFLDSDDWWEPEYLETAAIAFEGSPTAAMAVSDIHMVLLYEQPPSDYVHPCRRNSAYDDLVENLLLENFITTMSCVVVRRSAISAVGLLVESLRVVHDNEWYLRLATQGTVVCTEKALVWRTIDQDNLVSDLDRFLADHLRFLVTFFSTPLGSKYRQLRWRAVSLIFEGFAGMAAGRGNHWLAARHLTVAYAYTCRDLTPKTKLLQQGLAAARRAVRTSTTAALRAFR